MAVIAEVGTRHYYHKLGLFFLPFQQFFIFTQNLTFFSLLSRIRWSLHVENALLNKIRLVVELFWSAKGYRVMEISKADIFRFFRWLVPQVESLFRCSTNLKKLMEPLLSVSIAAYN